MGSEQSLGELEGDEGPVPRPPGPRDPLLVLYGAEGLGGGHAVGKRVGSHQPLVKYRTKEKEMATHSSVLAWRIPGAGEPCGLPSLVWHRVGHD